MKGLISIWLAPQSILDGIKGSIRHHSKSLQHWKVWLKWARRPAQSNPTEWGIRAGDIGHCTLIFKWTLQWSLPGGQTHCSQEGTKHTAPAPRQKHLGSGHLLHWDRCIGPVSYSQWSDSHPRPQCSVPGQNCRAGGWAWWKDELELAWETINRDQTFQG